MEQDNKIQIEIYGVKFVINSTEPKEYVKKIAKEIDKNIRDFMKTHSNSSVGDAYLISLLSYADRLEKEKILLEELKRELERCFEENKRKNFEINECKREIDRLKCELNLLRNSNKNKKQA